MPVLVLCFSASAGVLFIASVCSTLLAGLSLSLPVAQNHSLSDSVTLGMKRSRKTVSLPFSVDRERNTNTDTDTVTHTHTHEERADLTRGGTERGASVAGLLYGVCVCIVILFYFFFWLLLAFHEWPVSCCATGGFFCLFILALSFGSAVVQYFAESCLLSLSPFLLVRKPSLSL